MAWRTKLSHLFNVLLNLKWTKVIVKHRSKIERLSQVRNSNYIHNFWTLNENTTLKHSHCLGKKPYQTTKVKQGRVLTGLLCQSYQLHSALSETVALALSSCKKVCRFAKCHCNSIDIGLVFSSFEISNMFMVKVPIPCGLFPKYASFHVLAVMPATCISAKPPHFCMCICEHMLSDGVSHIFKHCLTKLSAMPRFML